ncbi:Foldase protein PrsA precursor [Labilithrix luteola]|uniref:Foldase protein PrsA n=1 Tax=Labilithrix luteola TaxID=1391654 RepID=A0A0K1Q196_9BACT|nr:peptidylprolyl isomerase [Labilithrix luteola]AKU99553.1 Foldase protein PrsA precursor [Labilithrix luteola]
MLDFFRQKNLTSVVYGTIVVGMIMVFVLGFNPSAGKKLSPVNESCAAKVKGSCIEPKAHRAAYRLIFSRGTGGMKQATASRIVLEGLIERELLVDEAERLGLTVSEDEITDSIFHGNVRLSLPADNVQMQRGLGIDDGKVIVPFKDPKTKTFDMKTYERLVKQITGRSPNEFRDWQTRELLAAKMRDLVRAPVRVADDEAFDRYQVERTNATVSYAVVRRNWLEKYAISSDQKDIDAWAKDKANLGEIKVPVRHILVKFPGEKDEDKAAAKAKAEGLLERVKKGEDFAKLAKEFSDDPGSKEKGGQYPGEMVEQFVEPFKVAVASVKPGELVPNLVETQFGYHIIKRDEATKEDIAKAYKNSKSLELSKNVAQKIAADIKAGKTGDEAVKAAIAQYGVVKPAAPKPAGKTEAGDASAEAATTYTAETDPERPQFLTSSAFNRGGEPIPAITAEAAENVSKFAFSAKPSDVSEPIRTDDGFLLVQLKDRKPATREEFDKERDQYKAGLLAAKQAEALAFYVKRLREASKSEIKVDDNNIFGAKSDAGASSQEDDDEGP